MSQTPAVPSPGDYLRSELAKRRWTQADLAKILDRPLPTVNRILLGKHAILPDMAMSLGAAFGDGAEAWMLRESVYRLSLANPATDSVRRRAKLFELLPLKDIQRRQWIKETDDIDALEREICRFLEIETIDDSLNVAFAPRESSGADGLTRQQLAWCYRTRQLAKALRVGEFDPKRVADCAQAMRALFAHPEEARKLPTLLSKYGIRFLVVEPLPGSKIDGVAFWLSATEPVIAVSIRFDRVDAFWFTVAHEVAHIYNGDAMSLDTDLAGEDQAPIDSKPDIEQRADKFAVDLLVPQDLLDSFVTRMSPLYSKTRIIQFAHRIKVHPGIIVGQLQYRGEIGYRANREMLVKIRDIVAASAVTDGWDHTVSLEP